MLYTIKMDLEVSFISYFIFLSHLPQDNNCIPPVVVRVAILVLRINTAET